MLVVGSISNPEEQHQIRLIAELFIVGQRARYLGYIGSKKNNQKKQKEKK